MAQFPWCRHKSARHPRRRGAFSISERNAPFPLQLRFMTRPFALFNGLTLKKQAGRLLPNWIMSLRCRLAPENFLTHLVANVSETTFNCAQRRVRLYNRVAVDTTRNMLLGALTLPCLADDARWKFMKRTFRCDLELSEKISPEIYRYGDTQRRSGWRR